MATHGRAGGAAADLRAVLITLGALGLSIGVLFSIGGATPAAGPSASQMPTTTTTTLPAGTASSTSTSTSPATATKVVVLAPAGAPSTTGVKNKLTQAGDVLVSHASIPASWVSTLRQPIVRYPVGLFDEAVAVARALGLKTDVVSAEPSGTSDGADVIEVFVPAS